MTENVESLGVLHDRWFRDAFGRLPARETHATCSDCAMCQPQSNIRYLPSTKCCTYFPLLPNYQVGGLFCSDTVSQTIKDSLAVGLERDWVTPRGIGRPLANEIQYNSRSHAEFGQSSALACPYLNSSGTGTCTIWQYRNSVCATWFCKMTHGAPSFYFWDATRVLLTAVEEALSLWCALELGLSPQASVRSSLWRDQQGSKNDDRRLDGFRQVGDATSWGSWHQDRVGYFERCFTLVAGLSWPDITRIGGVKVTALADIVGNRLARLGVADTPQRLRRGKILLVGHLDNDLALAVTYRDLDPQYIGLPLLNATRHFIGQPVEDAVAQAAAVDGVTLDHALIARLVDFRFLVEAQAPGASQPPSTPTVP